VIAKRNAKKYRGPYKNKGRRWFVCYDWLIGYQNGKPKYKRFQESGDLGRIKAFLYGKMPRVVYTKTI
jgi:hypothetical protein